DHIDGEVNVVSIANRTAHVFVAKPYVKDVVDLKGRKIAGDLKGGSSMDAKMVMRHFGVDPEKDVTWIDSRGKPPNTERFRLALFEKGEVDAVCCDPPHWNIAVQMGGHALQSCRDLFSIPEAGFSTSPAVIAEKPLVVKRWCARFYEGSWLLSTARKKPSIRFYATTISSIASLRVWLTMRCTRSGDRCWISKLIKEKLIFIRTSGTYRRSR